MGIAYSGGGSTKKQGGLYVFGGNFADVSPARYALDAALYRRQTVFLHERCSLHKSGSEQNISG